MALSKRHGEQCYKYEHAQKYQDQVAFTKSDGAFLRASAIESGPRTPTSLWTPNAPRERRSRRGKTERLALSCPQHIDGRNPPTGPQHLRYFPPLQSFPDVIAGHLDGLAQGASHLSIVNHSSPPHRHHQPSLSRHGTIDLSPLSSIT